MLWDGTRLATTLLDPATAPAHELIELYHERWEAELTVDELKTHQHLSGHTLRSLTPDGVLQELYGWFLAHDALRSLIHKVLEYVSLFFKILFSSQISQIPPSPS